MTTLLAVASACAAPSAPPAPTVAPAPKVEAKPAESAKPAAAASAAPANAATSAAAPAAAAAGQPRKGGKLIMAVREEPLNQDPHRLGSAVSRIMISNTHDTLVQIDDKGVRSPGWRCPGSKMIPPPGLSPCVKASNFRTGLLSMPRPSRSTWTA